MRITIDGHLGPGVSAKDLALHWISRWGSEYARGYAVEYAGSTVRNMSMDARMTLCNLSIEGGARSGMIAPDETTFNYIQGRPYAPEGDAWELAISDWKRLKSNPNATFDRCVKIDATLVAPTVTWGTSPDQALPIDVPIPNPDTLPENQAEAAKDALAYMDLHHGQSLEGTAIDQVFLGSCTNARLEDLRTAAAVLKGRKAKVGGLVSPGSTAIKRAAEAEGLDRVFIEAGLQWVNSGCSSCVAMNGDSIGRGKRCASSTNRNFRGRQGVGSRTHLMSPAMVAAAAIKGRIVDVRSLNIQSLDSTDNSAASTR